MRCGLAKRVKMLARAVVEVPLRGTDNSLTMTKLRASSKLLLGP